MHDGNQSTLAGVVAEKRSQLSAQIAANTFAG
jgi:hypothetical protein